MTGVEKFIGCLLGTLSNTLFNIMQIMRHKKGRSERPSFAARKINLSRVFLSQPLRDDK